MNRDTSCDAREARQLGMEAGITRRDFVNGVVAGASLLSTATLADPARMPPELGPDWTGPGGIGDYAHANGNTHEVVNSAHSVRNGAWDRPPTNAQVEDTIHDLVVVGGGITGLICAWEFREHQRRTGRPSGRCLVLDNHRMFGGEAKGNLFEVDGYRLAAPQGSNATLVPAAGLGKIYWDALKLPVEYQFAEPEGTSQPIRMGRDHYGPMQYTVEATSIGYWFRNEHTGGRSRFIRDMWNDGLSEAPLDPQLKQDLLRWYRAEEIELPAGMKPLPPAADLLAWREVTETSGVASWLDRMSYADYLEKVMGLSPSVSRYVDPLVAVGLSGTASDAVSAYGAQRILLPGVTPHSITSSYGQRGIFASPIGNGFIARYLVKNLVPSAIPGGNSLSEVIDTPVSLPELDRAGADVRIRLNATVVRVEHEGSPRMAETVRVTYLRDGAPFVARARHVIMASGGWINRYVVRDLPDDVREAYASFTNGPVLTVNIALRHWRFLDRLGISGARWFEGLGFFGSIAQPMKMGPGWAPLDPAKPIAFTCYVPFLNPGLPPVAQCALGRTQLLRQSFADLELQIRRQMQSMFGAYGFDARRDIAGIVLNRWGHAYICPQPGFFFGSEGRPAPRDAVRKGYGRVAFAHAELQGNQSWASSALEAKRASEQTAARMEGEFRY